MGLLHFKLDGAWESSALFSWVNMLPNSRVVGMISKIQPNKHFMFFFYKFNLKLGIFRLVKAKDLLEEY